MKFSHLDEEGKAKMVDVSGKEVTKRTAVASGFVKIDPEVIKLINDGEMPKGDVLTIAKIAGIQAAKRTDQLIPMCHPLGLDYIDIELEVVQDGIRIKSTASLTAKTGVEMEALTAVSVAALTIYDMCKSADRTMEIREIHLDEKSGGRSGKFVRNINMIEAKIIAVSVGTEKQKPKKNQDKVMLIKDHGLEGDVHAGTENQQVSFIGIEVYDRIESIKGLKFNPGDFEENITTRGIDLTILAVGAKIKIGDVELQVTRIGKTGSEDFYLNDQLGEPPLKKDGIFADVMKGGEISPGDKLEIIF